MPTVHSIRLSIARWRATRRLVLGAIALAGTIAATAAVVHRAVDVDVVTSQRTTRAHTYSGIGIQISGAKGAHPVISRVFPNTPAASALVRGDRLISVDGDQPTTPDGWVSAIRGTPGSSVELEVASRCRGHRHVTLVRDVIRVEKRSRRARCR